MALVRELVRALGRSGQIGAPFRADETLVLERSKQPVEIADVDSPLHPELRDALEQLVAVQRALPQEQQQRRLDEALDPGVNVPVAGPDEVPAAGAGTSLVGHSEQYR